MRLTNTPSPTSIAIATSARRGRFDTAEHVTLLRHLAPHLQQTLHVQRLLGDASQQDLALAAAGESLKHGVIAVTTDGRMAYANPKAEAILRLQDGLRFAAGRLHASIPSEDRELHHGLGLALTAEPRTGYTMRCSRRSGSRGYIVHVSPLGAPAAASIPIDPLALIVIVDPEQELTLSVADVRRLFGLTASEAQVALMVIDSHGLKAIAEQLSVTLATVKSHLNAVFQKTGTHRQSELIRLFLSLDRSVVERDRGNGVSGRRAPGRVGGGEVMR